MKKIILTRHAKTEPQAMDIRDRERRLTKRGYKDIDLVAKYIINEKQVPQMIYHSSAERTTQTAKEFVDIFRDVTGELVEMISVNSLYQASVEDINDIIYTLSEDLDRVMIIGHNPSVAMYLAQLGYNLHVPTTGTGFIKSMESKWFDWNKSPQKLDEVITPKMFK